jgi:hypothetical protein
MTPIDRAIDRRDQSGSYLYGLSVSTVYRIVNGETEAAA